MSPEMKMTVGDLRSRYAFLFGSVAELYRLCYGKKPSTRFEDIKAATETMAADDRLSDYLRENLEKLYSLYPSLLPGRSNDQSFLESLGELLTIIIGDVCAEINEISDAAQRHDTEQLLKKLIG